VCDGARVLALAALVIASDACGNARSRGVPIDAASADTDAEEWCAERGTWSCQRQWARGDIDDPARDACIGEVQAACPGATWPPGCAPTRVERDACISALMSVDRLDEPEDTLPECNTLCAP
jgi:hypothetical protein